MSRNRKYKNPTYDMVNGKREQTKCYKTWKNMIQRCYSDKALERRPTYIGCSVCTEWLDYDNFYEWFQENYREGFSLDKDILVQDNKVYSPSTCVFVPQYINLLFIKSDSSRGDFPLGVNYKKPSNKYQAMCSKGKGKLVHLGYFSDPLEAHKAYCEYKYQLIKDIASEALKNGDIDNRIYEAMINYKIPMF